MNITDSDYTLLYILGNISCTFIRKIKFNIKTSNITEHIYKLSFAGEKGSYGYQSSCAAWGAVAFAVQEDRCPIEDFGTQSWQAHNSSTIIAFFTKIYFLNNFVGVHKRELWNLGCFLWWFWWDRVNFLRSSWHGACAMDLCWKLLIIQRCFSSLWTELAQNQGLFSFSSPQQVAWGCTSIWEGTQIWLTQTDQKNVPHQMMPCSVTKLWGRLAGGYCWGSVWASACWWWPIVFICITCLSGVLFLSVLFSFSLLLFYYSLYYEII